MINKMKAHRFLSGKTQDQLYVETGIPQAKISKIENGYLKPNKKEKRDLAKALGTKPEDLFSDI